MYAMHGLRGLGATQDQVIQSIQRVGNSPYWPASWGGKAILLDGTVTGFQGVVPNVVTGFGNPGFTTTWPFAFAYVQLAGGWSREATDLYPQESAAKAQQWVGQGPTGAPVVTGTGALPPSSQPTGPLPAYVAPGSQPSAPAPITIFEPPPVAPIFGQPSASLGPSASGGFLPNPTPIGLLPPAGGFTLATPPGGDTLTTMPVPGPAPAPIDFGTGGGGGGAMPTDASGAGAPALPSALSDIPWWGWLLAVASVAYVVKRRPRGQ